MERKARQENIEALRILAMLMVITMHYLQKGGILLPLSENTGGVNLLAWLVESLCIGAANAYVLISGYFLVEASWKWQKLVSLVVQIWLYSFMIPLICLALSIGNVAEWTVYDWITALFPLGAEHYWFATAYLVLYLFVPVLQAGVKVLDKKQHQLVLGLLLIAFSLVKSLSPVLLPTDHYGYDFGWFMILFLVAAYFRLYGFSFLEKGNRALWIYLGTAVLIWGLSLGMAALSSMGLPLAYMRDMLYSYNHVLVLVLSVALFVAFSRLEIRTKWLKILVLSVAPYTFGVYLLHENMAVCYLWQQWSKIEGVRGSFLFVPHMVITVCLVFLGGVAVDFFRSCLFGAVAALRKGGAL